MQSKQNVYYNFKEISEMGEDNNDVISIGDLIILSEYGIAFYKENSFLTNGYDLKNIKTKVFLVKELYHNSASLIVTELDSDDNKLGVTKKHFRLATSYEIKIHKLKNSFIKK
jgi:hypothetical protein